MPNTSDLSTDVAKLLETFGVVNYEEGAGGNAFVEWMPQAPDQAVALYTTGGPEGHGKAPYDNPNLQIIVRGTKDARTAMVKAATIYDKLHALGPRTLASGLQLIYMFGIQSAPVRIGPDENGRHQYSLNFRTEVRNVTSNRPV